jgi:hypothetical protein
MGEGNALPVTAAYVASDALYTCDLTTGVNSCNGSTLSKKDFEGVAQQYWFKAIIKRADRFKNPIWMILLLRVVRTPPTSVSVKLREFEASGAGRQSLSTMGIPFRGIDPRRFSVFSALFEAVITGHSRPLAIMAISKWRKETTYWTVEVWWNTKSSDPVVRSLWTLGSVGLSRHLPVLACVGWNQTGA